MHRLTHTGEKPCVCDFCGRGFAFKATMVDHRKVHSEATHFKCETCGKEFKWRQQLQRHMMDHTGVSTNILIILDDDNNPILGETISLWPMQFSFQGQKWIDEAQALSS